MAPSTESLPAIGDVEKPKVQSNGPTPRTGKLPGIGASEELAGVLFDQLAPGQVAKRIYEADGKYYVVQLTAKQSVDLKDFDKKADQLVEELRASRAQAFLKQWLKSRCEQLVKDGKIKPNPGLLVEHDDEGKPLPVTYKPCMTF